MLTVGAGNGHGMTPGIHQFFSVTGNGNFAMSRGPGLKDFHVKISHWPIVWLPRWHFSEDPLTNDISASWFSLKAMITIVNWEDSLGCFNSSVGKPEPNIRTSQNLPHLQSIYGYDWILRVPFLQNWTLDLPFWMIKWWVVWSTLW